MTVVPKSRLYRRSRGSVHEKAYLPPNSPMVVRDTMYGQVRRLDAPDTVNLQILHCRISRMPTE